MRYLFGPSLAYSLSSKVSIGATLYYLYEKNKISSTQFVEGKSGSFSHTSNQDRRLTMRFTPIFGIQYMPTSRWSIGMSLRRYFTTAGHRGSSGIVSNSSSLDLSGTTNFLNTNRMGSQIQNNLILVNPSETYRIPELTEIRMGVANFSSKYFMFSYDAIYTGGYKLSANRNRMELTKPYLILTDSEDQRIKVCIEKLL
ncbi:MAG: hypothetical protein H7A23_10395 [Leptospiraceae bacterium]|nr:hypothetical protein [Leptospiraceae bacterium]MCP5494953.1 hypothetical protein [Leptospiraceae bacterium]